MEYNNLETTRPGLKNYTGTRVIKAPLAKIAWVLYTCEGKVDWKSNLISASELSRSDTTAMTNIPAEFVIHEHYNLAPGFQQRDYVLGSKWELSAGTKEEPKQAIMLMQSTEHDAMPVVEKRLRAAMNLLVYKLEALPGDQGTKVDVEVNLDAGGVLPVFAVNFYASMWPKKELLALEKQTLKTM